MLVCLFVCLFVCSFVCLFVFVIFSRLIYHKYELMDSQGILSLKDREIQGKNKEIKKELEKGEVCSLAIVDG